MHARKSRNKFTQSIACVMHNTVDVIKFCRTIRCFISKYVCRFIIAHSSRQKSKVLEEVTKRSGRVAGRSESCVTGRQDISGQLQARRARGREFQTFLRMQQ